MRFATAGTNAITPAYPMNEIPLDVRMRVLQCPYCGNTELGYGDELCDICQHELYNYCTNPACKRKNLGYARFCEACGAPTVFKRYGAFRTTTRSRRLTHDLFTRSRATPRVDHQENPMLVDSLWDDGFYH